MSGRMAPLLEVEALDVEFGRGAHRIRPVQQVDLRVEIGETVCLVGESGSGKSLASLAIMGLLPAASKRRARRLSLLGEDLLAARPRRMQDLRGDKVAMIFQDPMSALNPVLTIGDQLTEAWLRHRPSGSAEARARAVAMLDRVGIPSAGERLAQYPHQLSGGLRQRVMIAQALICDPALLIADEPTTALDVTLQKQILALLADLRRTYRLGVLLITHDLGVVANVADRVAVMYAGQVVETGPADKVLRQPAHPYTRGLLDAVLEIGRVAPRQPLPTIPGIVPRPTDRHGSCAFADRCALVRPCCREAPVALTCLPPDRTSRCLRAGELLGQGG